ncbi:hypothetical protein DN069_37395 [Streptacidiphilus pinicola]|uniref:Uncharacterized protein n=1 Tax=Streptacidiphilus pinicola TaxID=2219663 RepID=A0A2X0JUJ3_9ACTN|nr:hypothetical protein DN069_37395 [Streptacidiphilus pinicola]
MGRTWAALTAWAVLLFALECVFVSTLEPAELAPGASAAAVGAAGAAALSRLERVHAGPVARLAAALAVWPGTLLADTVLLVRLVAVSLVSGRRSRGSLRRCDCCPGPVWRGRPR